MRINVKSLQGSQYQVNVCPDDLVSALKDRISELAQGLQASKQKLVYKGRTMQDSSRLAEYLLEEDSKIYLIIQKETTTPTSSDQNLPSSSSSTNTTTTTTTTTAPNRPPQSRFETILKERLSQYFDENTIETIMVNLQFEIDQDIATAPLDDLERLAKQKLNISNE